MLKSYLIQGESNYWESYYVPAGDCSEKKHYKGEAF